MRLNLDPRARAFVRRMPRTTIYSLVELLLLAALAVQCARLLWTLVTPVSPLGAWQPTVGAVAGDPQQAARLRSFDPFFRLVDTGGSAVLTSLELTLYGTRVDEATGRGSAILAGPDEVQTSYAVGDEVLPGVILTNVGFDTVTLSRGGAEEILYIDQSQPAAAGDPAAAASPVPGATVTGSAAVQPQPTAAPADPRRGGPPPLDVEAIRRDLRFSAQAGGVAVSAAPGTSTLGQAGFVEGDVIVDVGGRPVRSAADIEAAAAGAQPGSSLSITVERGGARVPVSVPVGR